MLPSHSASSIRTTPARSNRPTGVETSSAGCSNGSRTVHTVAADSKVAEAAQLLLGADKKFPEELQPPSRQNGRLVFGVVGSQVWA